MTEPVLHGLLRLNQVLALYTVSKSSWWDGVKSGRYPQPVKIGPRSTAWFAEDIHKLMINLKSNIDCPDTEHNGNKL